LLKNKQVHEGALCHHLRPKSTDRPWITSRQERTLCAVGWQRGHSLPSFSVWSVFSANFHARNR